VRRAAKDQDRVNDGADGERKFMTCAPRRDWRARDPSCWRHVLSGGDALPL